VKKPLHSVSCSFSLFSAGPFRAGVFLLAVCLAACAGAVKETPPALDVPSADTPAAEVRQEPPAPLSAGPSFSQTGIVAWYGRDRHGLLSAAGEPINMHGLTAAHRTLPLGSMIRVTSLENQRTVLVRVIERGPAVNERIADLSAGAAEALGFLEQGTAKARIESTGPLPEGGLFTVLAATFFEEENAKVLKERLSKRFELVYITSLPVMTGRVYRLCVGAYGQEARAEQIAAKLTLEGLEPVVLRKD
jgi:rare lipoprotein A